MATSKNIGSKPPTNSILFSKENELEDDGNIRKSNLKQNTARDTKKYKKSIRQKYSNFNYSIRRLFDMDEGKELFFKLKSLKSESLFDSWTKLANTQKICLLRYYIQDAAIFLSVEEERSLAKIISKIIRHEHFPLIVAKLFFDISFNKGEFDRVNKKECLHQWESLTADERIIFLYDLCCLYPSTYKETPNIFDFAIHNPGYQIPVVVKELNRLIITSGNFQDVYNKYQNLNWQGLNIDERIILTNGLFEKHPGITENLDQVLYNVRVYQEVPVVVIAERENNAIDNYLNGGPVSIIIKMIIDHFNNSGHALPIIGVTDEKVRATLERFESNMS